MCFFVAGLMDSVGAVFPDDDDLAVELVGYCFDRRLVCNQGAVLFRASREIDGGPCGVVGGVDPDTSLLAKTPSCNRACFRVVVLVFSIDAISLKLRNRSGA